MTEPVKKPVPEVAKPEVPVAEVPKSEQVGRMIATVYGDMNDTQTGLSYTVVPCEVLKHSLWIESQLAAGKMVYTDTVEPVKAED